MKHLALLAALAALSACEGTPGSDAATPDGGVGDASRGDGGPVDGGVVDGGTDGGAPPTCDEVPEGPGRVLFVGNSFTFTASMPEVFDALAVAGGFPDPEVVMRAVGGQTLAFHRADTSAESAVSRVAEGWDVVVLQEFSTRPTDAIGPAEQFEIDATWFHDRALESNPATRVILYETFARRAGHSLYPGTFDDPADMQAQLSFWYHDCAERYLPMFSEADHVAIEIAHVGDAWERSLVDGEPPRLHDEDDYHPNGNGAYLTALVFFGTIYERSVVGLPAIGVDAETAIDLQAVADAVTGFTEPAPSIACPRELPVGDRLQIDFGPVDADTDGWTTHAAVLGATGPLTSAGGELTGAAVATRGFTGTQTGGRSDNALGMPGAVSSDTLWVGSFDGHAAAAMLSGEVTIAGLTPGQYTLTFFASRDGDDGGAGRLTRFTMGKESRDLDVADNADRTISFAGVAPDASGLISVRVAVSPDGAARFGYLGSLVIERMR